MFTESTARFGGRDVKVYLVRAELIEGRRADGAAMLGTGVSPPIWVQWHALRRGTFRYWTNRKYAPKGGPVHRAKIGKAVAIVGFDFINLDTLEVHGYYMLKMWRVGGPGLADYGRELDPLIPAEVTLCG